MCGAEQEALQDDHGHDREPAAQAAHHDAPEHHLLDDRRRDHRGDDERHHIGPIGADLLDPFGVSHQRHSERHEDGPDSDLGADCAEPDHRPPAEVRESRGQTDVGAEVAGSPTSTGVSTPPERRPVPDGGEHRDVQRHRPPEPDDRVEEVFRHDQRPAEDAHGPDGRHHRQRRGQRSSRRGRPDCGAGDGRREGGHGRGRARWRSGRQNVKKRSSLLQAAPERTATTRCSETAVRRPVAGSPLLATMTSARQRQIETSRDSTCHAPPPQQSPAIGSVRVGWQRRPGLRCSVQHWSPRRCRARCRRPVRPPTTGSASSTCIGRSRVSLPWPTTLPGRAALGTTRAGCC